MPDFNTRSLLVEKMDQPGVPDSEIKKALNEIETINTWLGGYQVTLDALRQFDNEQSLHLMDVGCGSGDILRKIAGWAKKRNINATLYGVDINPVMTQFAAEKSKSYSNIRYITSNVWDEQLNNYLPGIVTSNLFCHHFDNNELVRLIQRLYNLAEKGVIINDLHRHPFAYYAIKSLTSVFSDNSLVRYDAPLSVARSLRRKEWQNILEKAGIKNYQIKWMWAWRWQIILMKQ